MRILVVGDVHSVVDKLNECGRLIDYCFEIIKKDSVDYIIFLGDLFHNHSIVNTKVLNFWNKSFKQLGDFIKSIIVLKGNHDGALTDYADHALHLYKYLNTFVVDEPMELAGMNFMPYMHKEDFMKAYEQYFKGKNINLLFAHQSFVGSKMDNGFLDPNGINADELDVKQIVSGHIHTAQEFGKVWYPGSCNWRTISSSNQEKNIFVIDVEDGKIINKTKYDVSNVCEPIYLFEDNEITPINEELLNKKGNITINISGTKEYINKRVAVFEKLGWKIRTNIINNKKIEIRESDGITTSFNKFVENFRPENGTDIAILREMLSERVKL